MNATERYARQRQFAPIGREGQQAIEAAEIAILGCGALGSVAAEILCRAGVGRIRIIDRDVVEWSNLQRQSLFDSADADAGACKAESACRRLGQINPLIELMPRVVDVHPGNIESVLSGVDLVIDASDNFGLRLLLNDWAIVHGRPWVHGGCVGASGQVRLFDGSAPPCFRCLVPELPPAGAIATCDTAGVIGSATHAVASFQATEALKWLSGNQDAVSRDVISFDFWNNRIRSFQLDAGLSPNCKACVGREFDFLRGSALSASEGTLCGRDAVQLNPSPGDQKIELAEITRRWQTLGTVESTRFFVRLHVDEQIRLTLFRDGRVVVQGTDDVAKARSLVDRFVGS